MAGGGHDPNPIMEVIGELPPCLLLRLGATREISPAPFLLRGEMEEIVWTDSGGYVRRASVTSSTRDAPEMGIPVGPDVRLMDWDGIQRDLNNALQREGLLTWDDVQQSGDKLRGVLLGVTRNRLIALYRGE